jgi:hypothetical protein
LSRDSTIIMSSPFMVPVAWYPMPPFMGYYGFPAPNPHYQSPPMTPVETNRVNAKNSGSGNKCENFNDEFEGVLRLIDEARRYALEDDVSCIDNALKIVQNYGLDYALMDEFN